MSTIASSYAGKIIVLLTNAGGFPGAFMGFLLGASIVTINEIFATQFERDLRADGKIGGKYDRDNSMEEVQNIVSSSVQLLIDFEWFKIPDKIAKLLNTIKDHSIESLFEKVFSSEQ